MTSAMETFLAMLATRLRDRYGLCSGYWEVSRRPDSPSLHTHWLSMPKRCGR